MKNIYLFLAGFLLVSYSFAQAILPTSWSFDTAAPTGWSISGTTTYTSASAALSTPSCKLSGTGQFVQIFVTDDMGPVKYFLRSQTASGNPFTGTFTVQESVNGSAWTTLHSFGNGALDNNNYIEYSDQPNAASRYIRFYFTNKVSGWNVGLDSVSIAVAPPGPTQEINVLKASTQIPSGGTYVQASPVSTPVAIDFTIQNLGTVNALNISSAIITGSSDFVVTTTPSSVAASTSATLTVTFTPTTSGTILGYLTINNNDANEGTYVINLYGVGGNLATEAFSQPSSMNFNNLKSYRMNISFIDAFPQPEGYVILRKKGSAVTEVPVDGTVYTRGDYIGASQVISSGLVNSVWPSNVLAGTTYHYAIFSYNGPGIYRNYLTTAPTAANITTPANMMAANQYQGISPANANFIQALHDTVNPHTSKFYSEYEESILANFESRDTTNGQKVVTCVYSGENKIYTAPWDWGTTGYSREHTWSHTWMPTNPADNPEKPEYNDQHHLFPTNQNSVNSVRSNRPLGKVINVTSSYLGAKYGTDSVGNLVYEPRDEHKGDAARALFYMAICYTSVSGNLWTLPSNIGTAVPYGQDENILKAWHYQDPPSAYEIARNDYLDSLQKNRNPFIDSVDWVCYINFKTMTKISNPSFPCSIPDAISEKAKDENEVNIYPNPSNGNVQVNFAGTKTAEIKIYDILGSLRFSAASIHSTSFLNLSELSPGIYFIEIIRAGRTEIKKLILQ